MGSPAGPATEEKEPEASPASVASPSALDSKGTTKGVYGVEVVAAKPGPGGVVWHVSDVPVGCAKGKRKVCLGIDEAGRGPVMGTCRVKRGCVCGIVPL